MKRYSVSICPKRHLLCICDADLIQMQTECSTLVKSLAEGSSVTWADEVNYGTSHIMLHATGGSHNLPTEMECRTGNPSHTHPTGLQAPSHLPQFRGPTVCKILPTDLPTPCGNACERIPCMHIYDPTGIPTPYVGVPTIAVGHHIELVGGQRRCRSDCGLPTAKVL